MKKNTTTKTREKYDDKNMRKRLRQKKREKATTQTREKFDEKNMRKIR